MADVKPTQLTVNGITGEEVITELSPKQVAEREAESLAFEQARAARIAARESALAKLAALGLTEEEIAAL
jgi:DNA-binding NarL/FixJ family response regulator